MHTLFSSSFVPLAVAFSILVVAACFEFKTILIPNKFTFAAIGAALLFAGAKSIFAPMAEGGVAQAVAGLLLGGALLMPLYVKCGLGAGCVKTHAAFGAWLGCGFGFAACAKMIVLASICAAVLIFLCSWIKRLQGQNWTLAQPAISIGTVLGVIGSSWL